MILFVLVLGQLAHAQETYVLDELTDKWVLTNAPEPGSPEEQLTVAAKNLAMGKYQEAIRLTNIWIERHKRHPLIGEAHIIHGDALFAQKYFYESLFDYEIVARDYYGTQAAIIANERELEIATMFAHGTRKILWGMRIASATDEAEELFIRIQERLPRSLLAETAALELADLYYRSKKMQLANDMYLIFVENYPSSEYIEKAKARLIYTRLATYRGPAFDSAGLIDAKRELDRLEKTDTRLAKIVESTALKTRIDESLGQKMLRTAQWYLKVNNPIAAEYTVRRLVKKYPQTAATIEALEHLVPDFMPKLPPIIRSNIGELYEIYQELLLGRIITAADLEEKK
ncbi:MAG: outer membrane protein assembly factor BamD [Phycisphaerae bacterium]|jgi:outer membrane protein assembly factor BamD (BamD/ComL family)|nr:outer membrane protein assembly factor BamD [Phycisphaerae bacterium]MBT6269371.1 outer membrane protein assembly factor BamD [Phycisphaerae bacterium]MBT6282113.1 outer membrane protein assembly factor BamD [Phycisphaerae bacterium]